jgi:hypothetical protein
MSTISTSTITPTRDRGGTSGIDIDGSAYRCCDTAGGAVPARGGTLPGAAFGPEPCIGGMLDGERFGGRCTLGGVT